MSVGNEMDILLFRQRKETQGSMLRKIDMTALNSCPTFGAKIKTFFVLSKYLGIVESGTKKSIMAAS